MGGLLAARVLARRLRPGDVIERDELPAGARPGKACPRAGTVTASTPPACRSSRTSSLASPPRPRPTAPPSSPPPRSAGSRRVTRCAGPTWRPAPLGEPPLHRRPRPPPGRRARRRHDRRRLRRPRPGPSRWRPDHRRPDPAPTGRQQPKRCSTPTWSSTPPAGPARPCSWLDDLGFPRPAEEELRVDVTYATRRIQLPAGALGPDRIVVVGPRPGRLSRHVPRRAGRRMVDPHRVRLPGPRTGARPRRVHGVRAAVAPPDLAAALEQAVPLTDVVTHRLPSSLRRRYDKLRRFPTGFLACSATRSAASTRSTARA